MEPTNICDSEEERGAGCQHAQRCEEHLFLLGVERRARMGRSANDEHNKRMGPKTEGHYTRSGVDRTVRARVTPGAWSSLRSAQQDVADKVVNGTTLEYCSR